MGKQASEQASKYEREIDDESSEWYDAAYGFGR